MGVNESVGAGDTAALGRDGLILDALWVYV